MPKINQVWEFKKQRIIISRVNDVGLVGYNCSTHLWDAFMVKSFLEIAKPISRLSDSI